MYNRADIRGTPAFEAFDPLTSQNLLAGSEPPLGPTTRLLLDDSLNLAQFTVVGLNAGRLVPAVFGVTPAIGVLAHAASSGAANATKYGEVFLTGDFNVGDDSPLVFDASFDTLAKKVSVASPTLKFRTRRATGSAAGVA